MGNLMRTPLTSTATEQYGTSNFKIGVATMHGCRLTMEDKHTIITKSQIHPNLAYFMIFDGHMGIESAQFMSTELYKLLDASISPTNSENLKAIFLDADQRLLLSEKHRRSGCTAALAIIDVDTRIITTAYIGDTRIIVIRNEDMVFVTNDHKPEDIIEYNRIINAGGVVNNGRVDSNLNLSRAFGDFSFKQASHLSDKEQRIIALPQIDYIPYDDNCSILIACDGIFEQLTTAEVVEFVINHEDYNKDPVVVVTDLCNKSVLAGSLDNMSAMLINICPGEFYDTCKKYNPMAVGPGHLKDSTFSKIYTDECLAHNHTLRSALIAAEYNLISQKYRPLIYDYNMFQELVKASMTDDELLNNIHKL